MSIKRIILSLLAILPAGPTSVMAQSELLDTDAQVDPEALGGRLGLARRLLFPAGKNVVSLQQSAEHFESVLPEEGFAGLSEDEKAEVFDQAIELLERRGLLEEKTGIISSVPSGWGKF